MTDAYPIYAVYVLLRGRPHIFHAELSALEAELLARSTRYTFSCPTWVEQLQPRVPAHFGYFGYGAIPWPRQRVAS